MKLRERLRAAEPAYGLWVTLESPSVSEAASDLDIDWVCVDMEHNHLSHADLLAHLRATKGSRVTVLVRPPIADRESIKRALDLGADGVLLPLVESTEEVDAALSSAYYPPRGRRSVGHDRATMWGRRWEEYVAGANDEVLVIPIVETVEAVAAFDSIISLEGVSAVFFGPADLSASHGHLGMWEGPGIAELILQLKDRARGSGVVAGVMATGIADAESRRQQGFEMIGLGSDIGLLLGALDRSLATLRGSDQALGTD